MPLSLSHATSARRFLDSPAVEEAIALLVRELQEARASITEVRPPVSELAESYASALAALEQQRGRAPFYPYLGSGLGNGALVELADGSVKWDLITGIGVHPFGHSDGDLVATAVRAALSDTVMQGNLQCNADAIAFADLLLEEAGRSSRLRYCFLTNSGAMANEAALKVCFQRNAPAPRVLAFAGCFAGRSTALAQITDNPGYRVGLPPGLPVDYVPFHDPAAGAASLASARRCLDELIERYPGQHACFAMELVQGEGGFNVAPREFLLPLMATCRERGIGVWVDEVQTFGRTPSMFYSEQLQLGEHVDVLTLGKMSQACACLYTAEYAPKPGLLSGTFIGSAVALRTGRRVLERLRDGGYYGPSGRIAALFKTFCEHVQALVARHPAWFPPVPPVPTVPAAHGGPGTVQPFGGVGGMMRFTPFGGDKAAIMKLLNALFERGVIAFFCGHGPYHVRFLPPVGVMRSEQFTEVFEIVEAAMADVARGEPAAKKG